MNSALTHNPHTRQNGVAIIVVLGFLVLLFALVTAFLARTSVERTSAASFAAAVSTERLADVAVNLVQGQIRDATTQGTAVAWTSQPGMIRNFNTNAQQIRAYKLYSASELVVPGAGLAASIVADAPPTEWDEAGALWTDLNAPVWVPDPNDPAGDPVARYPILDAGARGTVEGFSVDDDAPIAANGNAVPMPVRWLYVLRDGTLLAPDPESSDALRADVPGASNENSIVGRIAFWTDDETSKLNINTSSEGTYWDVPKVFTNQDMTFARNQPARGEFQRYPGHPAMNSLAPVFFAEVPEGGGDPAAPNPLTLEQRDALYEIIPRIIGGGSNGGTTVPTGPLVPDGDRLYSTVDELVFDSERALHLVAAGIDHARIQSAKFFLTASSRAPEITLFNTPRVAMWPIDANEDDDYRSAYDRLLAHCATINGHPYYFTRSDPGSQSVDFPGAPTTDPQTGLGRNRNLYAYLQELTSRPTPGFGGTMLAKYGDDRDQILTLMFDYIRTTNVDDSTLLGVTADGTSRRYGLRRREGPNNNIMTFDGWRQVVDSFGAYGFNQVVPIRIGNTQGHGRFPVISEAGVAFICSADGGDGTEGGLYGSNVAANRTLDPNPADPASSPVILLEPGQRRIEALFFLQPFLAAQGYPTVNSNFSVRVQGLQSFRVTANGEEQSLAFPADGVAWWRTNSSSSIVDTRRSGGVLCPRWGLSNRFLPQRGAMPADVPNRSPASENAYSIYPFVSHPVTVNAAAGTMEFSGGTVTVEIYATRELSLPIPSDQELVQTITLNFPPATIPIPELVALGTPFDVNSQNRETAMQDWWTFSADGCLPGTVQLWANAPSSEPTTRSRGRLGLASLSVATNGPVYRGGSLFRDEDVVRSLVPANHSDYRLLARPTLGAEVYAPHPAYNNGGQRLAHSLATEANAANFPGATFAPEYLAGITFPDSSAAATRPKVSIYNPNSVANGDWDNGIGMFGDGAFLNLPDGGNAIGLYNASQEVVPYFTTNLEGVPISWGALYSNNPDNSVANAGNGAGYTMAPIFTLHSPNRQVPSAGMFGSLPSGIQAGEPFRTLLFRPQQGHFGENGPRDHLWADLFWMPVVEPYAISEPFSTSGKINMNYQILPFTHIERWTALAGLLRSERVLAIPNNQVSDYKGSTNRNAEYRQTIDIKETISQFETVFSDNRVFVSATEIFDLHLVPEGQTLAALAGGAFWDNHRLTGDNSRERPYTNLLGRLTTKSNTYTVHYRVQALKKTPGSDEETWVEDRDQILAEARGSTIIERYINPNDPNIPDYASSADGEPTDAPDLGAFYKWRVVNTRTFVP